MEYYIVVVPFGLDYTIAMPPFTNLHVHSHYSLLQALPKLPDLIAAAKNEGCTALALTDLGNLYGAIEFIKECKKKGIKPILGVDVRLATDGNHRLVLLAENEAGYRNMLALVTDSYLAEKGDESETVKHLVTRENLRAHAVGLIAIAPSLCGEIASALHAQTTDHAEKLIHEYRDIFGDNNFYLEISKHEELDGHDELMLKLSALAENIGTPLVAGQEVFYINRDDRRAWETLRKIENSGVHGGGVDENGGIGAEEADCPFMCAAEMAEKFSDMPEALANTNKIADRCNVDLTLGKFVFPTFVLPEGKTNDDVLRELCMKGLKARNLEGQPEVLERLEYELNIIKMKGYAVYFLVVEDLIRFSRENGIYSNIRGSVAGSMTTYLLQITKIDPLVYKIPFERFLNPERPSAPDIDMDFADERREEVINYARAKYGADHVAQIGTFGTMLARGVVRDVTRALGYPYGLGDRIAKEIPFGSQGFAMTLDRALNENPELAKIYKEDEAKEIIDLGKKIEGCARHISVHAAGVVISPLPLVHYSPMQHDPKGGKLITQYDMYSVGEDGVGLTKFDFLGIRNLTILANAVDIIKKTRGITVDIENVRVDDAKTFAMLARGETEGTFQLNGPGMTKWLVELQPTTIHDINAMVALYRPGPMESIPQYIERKKNPTLTHYLDPRMRQYLDASFGLLVYQDDVLLTAITLGGYSWLEADKLRKAMGKKIPEVMQAEKDKLLKKLIEYGKLTPQLADKLWKLIEPFAAYGFGKAHAASYGKVAYQTSYLKANFPVEYMSAVLTAESGDIDTISIMVGECRRIKIPVLPPDVNESFGDFTAILADPVTRAPTTAATCEGYSNFSAEKLPEVASSVTRQTPFSDTAVVGAQAAQDSIRFGLYSIKNFGRGVADSVIAEREANGQFTSLSDFLRRVTTNGLNKRGLESLIQCGALDRFGERAQMSAAIEQLLEYHRDATKEQSHDSLFADLGSSVADVHLPTTEPATLEQRLEWEKELLGLYVSGHPLDRYREKLAKRPMNINQLKQKVRVGVDIVTAGMLANVRIILTQKGDQMAFLKLADDEGAIEAVAFPKTFTEYKDIIKQDACIAIKGKISNRNNELSIIIDKMKKL